jgi:hypothetical protein
MYFQPSVGIFYNYASTTYHGNTSGCNQQFRGNNLYGNAWSLTANGNFTTTGNISGAEVTETSALKYKDIERRVPLDESLSNVIKIGSLGAAVGTLKDDETKKVHRWFIADEVAKVVPEAVRYVDGEVDGLSYTRLLPDAYAAIAKQQEYIEKLEARLDRLEEKLNG